MVEPRDVNMVIVDMEIMDVPGEQGPEQWDIEMLDILEEVFMLDELEPCMIEPKPQAAPMEKQESFPGDPLDPTKLL